MPRSLRWQQRHVGLAWLRRNLGGGDRAKGLELFSGSGRVARKLARKCGVPTLALDIRSKRHPVDLTDKRVIRFLLFAIKHKMVKAVFFGTPCSSFSLARRGRPGKPGGPLRTIATIYGHPDAMARAIDRKKIIVGNKCAAATAVLAAAAHKHNVPWAIENPAYSRLWHYPSIAKLKALPGVVERVSHMCQYGAPWKKPTRVMMGHFWEKSGGEALLQRKCSGMQGCCSKTGLPHTTLQGTNPTTRRPFTSSAQVYPLVFATEAAFALAGPR